MTCRASVRASLGFAVTMLATACPHGGGKRPYAEPTVDDLLARINTVRDQVTSFSVDTTMDYWMNDERVKGSVLIMGTSGSKVRVNALSPAGETVMADLACNGTDYAYVDFNKNCQASGPCSRDTIAAMFHVALTPDDFVVMAVGATPIIEGATGTVRWDSKAGKEVLELTGAGGHTQTIVLDARDGHADVIASEVKDADGVQQWRIDNTGFSTIKDAAGMSRRVPDKSRFRSPGEKADLLVEWNERALGVELGDDKFAMAIPAGLPTCQ
jgi:hypothetical protein